MPLHYQTELSLSSTVDTRLQEAETLMDGYPEPSVHERFRRTYDALFQLMQYARSTGISTPYRAKLRELFYRKTDLYRRGWSRQDIDTLLGGSPDFVVKAGRGLAQLYFKQRVLEIEATPAWYRRPQAAARRLRKEGLTHRAIAEELNMSLGEVVLATREMRTPRGPRAPRRMPLDAAKATARAMKAEGKTQAEIRRATGLALNTISKVTADIEKPEPHAEAKHRARQMKAQGHTLAEIRDAIGKSLGWIRRVTAGVKRGKKFPPLHRAILGVLADGQEWKTSEIQAALSAARRSVAAALKRLVESGELQKVRHGVYQLQTWHGVMQRKG